MVRMIGTNGKSAGLAQCGVVELDPSSPGKIRDWKLLSICVRIMRLLPAKS